MSGEVLIGVDLGGTNVRAGRVEGGRLTAVRAVPVRSGGTEGEVLDDLWSAIDAVIGPDAAGLGVGVPSVIDLQAGIVYDVQNIPAWKKVPLKDLVEQRYGLPAYINNDANCFAAGEKHFGKARPYGHAVGLIIGTGLGAGIIANGRLYSGANCGAGEFGMLPYRDRNFEAYCSGQFFHIVCGTTGREAFERAARGEREALAMFAELGGHLGEAVKAICYAVDPEIIVLGGSVSRAYAYFREGLWRAFESYAYSLAREKLRIEVSETDNVAILGAAALYLDARVS